MVNRKKTMLFMNSPSYMYLIEDKLLRTRKDNPKLVDTKLIKLMPKTNSIGG